jgi:hypothetical protein
MISVVIFETKRLTARHLQPEDHAPMLRVYGDADAMRWVGDGQPIAPDGCAKWLKVTHNTIGWSRDAAAAQVLDCASANSVKGRRDEVVCALLVLIELAKHLAEPARLHAPRQEVRGVDCVRAERGQLECRLALP